MQNLQINSFVALRDLDGLPGASNFPYFFLDDVDVAPVVVDDVSILFNFEEMLDAA